MYMHMHMHMHMHMCMYMCMLLLCMLCMYRYRREQVLQHVFGCLGLLMELCGLLLPLTGAGRLLCVHVSIHTTIVREHMEQAHPSRTSG